MRFLTIPEAVARAAERFGGRPALSERGREETFAQLATSCACAGSAIRELGAGPGERVLLLAANSIAMVHAWLGAIQSGAIPAAVNPELTAGELDYLGADLGAAAVLADAERAEPGSALAGRLGARFALIEALDQGHDLLEARPVDPLETAAIVYTSGTTSRPKGVQVRHAAYTETGLSFPGWAGLGEDERLWACLPLFHINAQAYSLMTSLLCGFPLALSAKFHATSFWRDAEELGVTAVNVIGAMIAFLERQPAESWVASPLRTIYAAPVPAPEERKRLEERFQVRILGGYGMSENTFGCAESPTSRDKPGSIGRPRQPASGAFENRLRIESGELCFQNPVLTSGYWKAPEITARTLVDGWLHTGDLGYQDADGDVFLSGRVKEMIRRRGENISPGEVEDALREHPAVADAAVFGIPAEGGEEEVVAAVVLAAGAPATQEELRDFAGLRLARFKVPSAIAFRDSLPMTATMRVARDRLREEYLARS